jgi:hypothetical protein
MKHLLLSILVLFSLSVSAQVYDPSKHIPVNKGLGVAQAAPTDARSMFYDANNFVYRPYQSTAEVLTYLSLAKYRVGGFDIIVNSGGTLANGVITGGTNSIYYFKDGTDDEDLTLKGSSASLTNLGSGFKIGVAGSTNLKTAFSGYGVTVDSTSNSNGLTFKIDTATLFDDLPTADNDTAYLDVKKDFNAAGDGSADDAAEFQAMFDWVESNPNRVFKCIIPAGNYKILSTVQLPQRINSSTNSPRLLIEGYGARLFTTNAIAIFERLPATQTIALDSLISNWIPTFRGLTFEGNQTTGQVGLRIGATYSMSIEDCIFDLLDTGMVSVFGLQATIKNCRFPRNKTEGLYIGFGERWGGTDANSASNSNLVENCQVSGTSGQYAHLHAEAANGLIVRNFISEGAKPKYNFDIDSRGSTTVKFTDISDVHVEATGGVYSSNTVFKIRAGGTVQIKNVFLQYPDTLFNSTNSASSSHIIFDGIPYIAALPTVAFNANGVQSTSYFITFKNVLDGGVFKTKLFNTASWVGGVVPISLYYQYEKAGSSGTYAIAPGGTIDLEPGQSSTPKNVRIFGGLEFKDDNTYDFGLTNGPTNVRPRDGYFGRNLYVGTSGRMYWGDAATTPDLSIARGASGRMDIMDNGSGWADLKMKTLTLTAQLNAINLSGSSIVPDSSLYRNPSTGDVVSVKLPVYSTVILASDQTNNNAVALTWEDVTGLQFPVESGKTYVFRFYVTYDCGSTTTGSKWAINGPTLTSTSYRQGAARSITNVFWNVNNDYDQGSNSGETAFLTGNFVTVEGIIRCSASGNVVLRHASETSGVAVTAKAGLSFVEYRKID